MSAPDPRAKPDQHLDPVVAAGYDATHRDRFLPAAVDPAVDLLVELAGGGPVVEFAVGTGRLALPLAERGVEVQGIDLSEPMLAELRRKDPDGRVPVTVGDMTETIVRRDAGLVYLVYNTIENLRTQAQQVACFRNAAANLAPGGRFLIEVLVPTVTLVPPGQRYRPFEVSPGYVGFDEYLDPVAQLSVSHHYHIDGDRVRQVSGVFRYAWPAELDLMAQLAGLEAEHRWADWDRSPFDRHSTAHVSVWRKPG